MYIDKNKISNKIIWTKKFFTKFLLIFLPKNGKRKPRKIINEHAENASKLRYLRFRSTASRTVDRTVDRIQDRTMSVNHFLKTAFTHFRSENPNFRAPHDHRSIRRHARAIADFAEAEGMMFISSCPEYESMGLMRKTIRNRKSRSSQQFHLQLRCLHYRKWQSTSRTLNAPSFLNLEVDRRIFQSTSLIWSWKMRSSPDFKRRWKVLWHPLTFTTWKDHLEFRTLGIFTIWIDLIWN